MNLNEIYFPVEKIPNPELAKGVELPSGLQYAVQVTKPDGVKRTVNYCSEIYHLVPNDTVIPLFLETISKYYKVEATAKINQWARFHIDFILKDKGVTITKGDPVFPNIRIINSYDGTIKYQYANRFWRQICSNGMGVWVGGDLHIKTMHTPAIGEEVSFEGVMEMTSKFLAELGEHTEVYKELGDHVVRNPELRVEEIIDETSFPTSLHEDVLFRLTEEKEQLRLPEITDWLVYNAFNYQLNHNEELKAKESKREKMDQEVLTYLLNY